MPMKMPKKTARAKILEEERVSWRDLHAIGHAPTPPKESDVPAEVRYREVHPLFRSMPHFCPERKS